MRQLKELYPAYAGRVVLLVIGIDPTETAETLRANREREGYPWLVAASHPEVATAYGILTRATKVAVDRQGTIVFREGYGVQPRERWERLLRELAGD